MATRNSAKISAEIKSYLDDAIKNLVTKSDIKTEKISTLDEKLNASEASIEKLNNKSLTLKENQHTANHGRQMIWNSTGTENL